MSSVTQRVKNVQQPRGGYLPIKNFTKEIFNDENILNESENISPSLVGTAVDYLTRFMLENNVDKAFRISLLGAEAIRMENKAHILKQKISGLDDVSIIAACKLVGFDVCYRSSISSYRPIEEISPDNFTIQNIRVMVKRSLSFFEKYGPIVLSEVTFHGGYTETVNSGDGDFVTEEILWDFKVSKTSPTSRHTLQILMYYIMGKHSVYKHLKNIKFLGFFNPRLNIAYICPVSSISKEMIAEVEKNVICYGVTVNKSNTTPAKTSFDNQIYYTVSEICKLNNLKRSHVYADIRNGKVIAFKKGNKYYITLENYRKYCEFIKRRNRAMAIFFLIYFILVIVMLVFLFQTVL